MLGSTRSSRALPPRLRLRGEGGRILYDRELPVSSALPRGRIILWSYNTPPTYICARKWITNKRKRLFSFSILIALTRRAILTNKIDNPAARFRDRYSMNYTVHVIYSVLYGKARYGFRVCVYARIKVNIKLVDISGTLSGTGCYRTVIEPSGSLPYSNFSAVFFRTGEIF